MVAEAGDLDKPFATAQTIAEVEAMSAATIDWYLASARASMQLRGIPTTKPSPLLRNSIGPMVPLLEVLLYPLIE